MNEYERIVKNKAKEILGPMGLRQKGASRLWFEDNGWYLTLVEFQPAHGTPGTFLNVGIFFLWHKDQDYVSFDYGHRESELIKHTENFENELQTLVLSAQEKVLFYRRFSDLPFAKECIMNHEFTSDDIWGVFHRAMILFLSGDDSAVEYLNMFDERKMKEIASWNKDVATFIQNIVNCFQDADDYKERIVLNICDQRDMLRNNGYKGLPITHPFLDRFKIFDK
jgi:hypothetical protein